MQGVLTPFDRLEGFERKQKDKGEDANSAKARSSGEASTSGEHHVLVAPRSSPFLSAFWVLMLLC